MICHYYLTYRCDSRCEFCNIWRDGEFEAGEEASLPVIEKNLSSLAGIGTKTVNFTGGEPLLRDDLAGILRAAKQRGLLTGLFTGGAGLSKRFPDLKGLIDRLYISLDSPEAKDHDRIRGQECFSEALDAVRSAAGGGMKVTINFTVTRNSIRYLPEMAEISEREGAVLRINPVHHFFGLEGFEKITVDYILRYSGRRHIDVDKALMGLLKEGGNRKDRPACRALEKVLTISPDDHLVLPCINAPHARVPINGGLDRIWGSDIVSGYRKMEGSLEKCEGCCDINYLSPSLHKRRDGSHLLDRISGCFRGSDRWRGLSGLFHAFF